MCVRVPRCWSANPVTLLRRGSLAAALALLTLALSTPGCAPEASPSPPVPDPPPALDEPLEIADFNSATVCGSCHPQHYAEWRHSNHAYAMIDPVYRALVDLRRRDLNPEDDHFCTQCHSAIGTRSGDCTPAFDFDALDPITLEGVTCEACHKVTTVERLFNSGHVIDSDGPIRGPIVNPYPSPFHDSVYSDLFESSSFCAGCHDVVEPHGLTLERPFEEWLASPAAQEGRVCQDCHMPTYSGYASVIAGAPRRENLHRHRWIGVDMPLDEQFIADPDERALIRDQVIELLTSSGEVSVDADARIEPGDELRFAVTVSNLTDAHNLPTGSTFFRQMWLAVTVRDAAGAVVYQTGQLDENGDLCDHWSAIEPGADPDLISFHSRLVDRDGAPTVMPWRAAEHRNDSLEPLESRQHSFAIDTDPALRGPLSIEVRLRFRALPPHLLRALGLERLLPNLEIVDIATAQVSVEVAM